MSCPLRIVVADDEVDMQDYYRKFLPRLGFIVAGVASTGRELVALCQSEKPDLVITDIKMPDMDGIQAAMTIYEHNPIPVILVSAHHDHDLIHRAEVDHVMSYLVKPLKLADLEPAIILAMKRFQQMEALRSQNESLRQRLQGTTDQPPSEPIS